MLMIVFRFAAGERVPCAAQRCAGSAHCLTGARSGSSVGASPAPPAWARVAEAHAGQGEALAAQAAVLAAVAAAVWLLRPAQRTYLIDWYSFRPPERCARGLCCAEAHSCTSSDRLGVRRGADVLHRGKGWYAGAVLTR